MGGGGGGRLFEGGCLLTFSAFRMGAYSRWVVIRDWALIRINTVIDTVGFFFYIFCSNLLLDIDILCYNPVKVDFQ